jgi:hypothetical protein
MVVGITTSYAIGVLRQVGGFLRVLRFPPPKKKTDSHDIAKILLKVKLNTIKLNRTFVIKPITVSLHIYTFIYIIINTNNTGICLCNFYSHTMFTKLTQ